MKIFKSAQDLVATLFRSAKRKALGLPATVSVAEKSKRLDLCRACPSYMSMNDMCVECFCVMDIKTTLVESSCPLKKWDRC